MSLLILGAGAAAREVYDWCLQSNKRVIGFYAEWSEVGTLRDLPVYTSPSEIPEDCQWVSGVGTPKVLSRLLDNIKQEPAEAIIHPSCILGSNVSVGRGSIVCPGSILTCDVVVGRGTIVNIACTIGHDCQIGDFCHLAPNTSLSGYTRVGHCCELGTGCSTIPHVEIKDHSVVGAGAVVTQNLKSGLIIGIPAINKKVW